MCGSDLPDDEFPDDVLHKGMDEVQVGCEYGFHYIFSRIFDWIEALIRRFS